MMKSESENWSATSSEENESAIELEAEGNSTEQAYLMGVEQERRDAKSESGDPEIDKPVHPEGRGDVEHHEGETHAEVDRRAGESRVEDREVDSGGGKTSTGSDVPSASERQVGQDRIGVDLRREDLENGRERHEMLAESDECSAGSSLGKLCNGKRGERDGSVSELERKNMRRVEKRRTLQEERQKGDEEDEEDRDDTSLDPVKDGIQIVATALAGEEVSGGVVLADREHRVERTEVDD
jgi:hypothetical protein